MSDTTNDAQAAPDSPNKDELFEEIHKIAQAWKGANGGIYCIRGMCLELLEKLFLPRLAAQPPAALVEGTFNCQTCERECDGPDGGYRCPVEQLRAALADIDISAYNAAKLRISWALAALETPRPRSSADNGDSKLPLHYEDGPDYCTVTDAQGSAFALTVQPELMQAMERALREDIDRLSRPPAISGQPQEAPDTTFGAIHDALKTANIEYSAFSTNGAVVFGDKKSVQMAAEAFHSHSQIDHFRTQIRHWREECGKLHARVKTEPTEPLQCLCCGTVDAFGPASSPLTRPK